jgi:hypothetical protein
MLLLIPVIGPPIYLEVAGAAAPGSVAAKRETINILTDTWMRRLFIDVRYQAADATDPEITEIAVDMATYDQLHAGQAVRVRYIPNPSLRMLGNLATARLDSQLPLGSFLARVGNVLIGFAIGIAVWLALLWGWSKRRSMWYAVGILGLMFGGVIYIGSNWPAPAPAPPLATASATIRDMHQVTRVWAGKRSSGEDAAQPYTIVELSFVPQGRLDPVIAVDSIDTGSVPDLEQGGEVAISYSASNPRSARIAGGSRTYYWKNLRSFGIIALIMVAALAIPWLFSRIRNSRRGSATP